MTQAEVKKIFDTFAWLIAGRMEEYFNESENEQAYNAWVQESTKKESNAGEQRCNKSERSTAK
jgi:hypothetical protein